MTPAAGAAVGFNPFLTDFAPTAYATYAACRRDAPILPVTGCAGTDWVLFRYHDIRQVLLDPSCVVDAPQVKARALARAAGVEHGVDRLCRMLDRWLFFVNPPDHGRLRELVDASFTKPAIDRLAGLTRQFVVERLERVIDSGRLDIMHDVAAPLPCLVTAAVLGVPLADVEAFVRWSSDLFGVFVQPMPLAGYRRLNALTAAFYACVDAAWRTPREVPGLLDRLVAQCDANRMDPEEVRAFAAMLFSVGQDTTQHLIGNAMAALIRHPDQLSWLRNHLELVPSAIKELARFDTPVQLIVRRAAADLDVAGHRIRASERLCLILGSAHHDEAVFPDPERLDIRRTQRSQLIFGSGIHRCLGSHLAYLVAGTAIAAMLESLGDLRLLSDSPPRIRSLHMRGFASLPCSFRPLRQGVRAQA